MSTYTEAASDEDVLPWQPLPLNWFREDSLVDLADNTHTHQVGHKSPLEGTQQCAYHGHTTVKLKLSGII